LVGKFALSFLSHFSYFVFRTVEELNEALGYLEEVAIRLIGSKSNIKSVGLASWDYLLLGRNPEGVIHHLARFLILHLQ